ncbi:hypothetical protein CAPTEDRAFT_217356 [Capitella teleta]|uniref:Transposase IS30-like HTH domain-containing protein n=1 Tax=Capitella teleta TaxID=283909 RepID=R7TU94_CAPTE|nr:hypothetical protein CAPTEDRAFT_217356 [Capitella teleta]|eukprot:ELT97239.1 hypothetical protein CAPTEDRAFT_217356 [Capitella teleta]
MGRKASLTPTKRAQIVALNDLGYSERKIAMKLTCSKTAVHTALANHRVRGSYTDQKRTGRPRKTTPQDDRVIRRAVVKSPSSSLTKLRSILLDRGVRLDKSTISRRVWIFAPRAQGGHAGALSTFSQERKKILEEDASFHRPAPVMSEDED